MAKFNWEYISLITKNIFLDFFEAHKFRRHSLYRALAMDAHREAVEFAKANLMRSRRFRSHGDVLRFCVGVAKKNFSGDELIAEFGVHEGRSLKVLCKEAPLSTIYGFDTFFTGMPEQWGTTLPKGHFSLAKLPKVPSNAKLQVGLFNDTLPEFLKNHQQKFALIHIDCNLYSATAGILNLLTERFFPGSVIIFGGFINVVGWQESEYKALMEWSAVKEIKFDYIAYNAEKALGAGSAVGIILR